MVDKHESMDSLSPLETFATKSELHNLENRMLGRLDKVGEDIHGAREQLATIRTQLSAIAEAQEGNAKKQGKLEERGRLTGPFVVALIVAAIGVLRFLDEGDDKERSENSAQIHDIQTNRFTRKDAEQLEEDLEDRMDRAAQRVENTKQELLAQIRIQAAWIAKHEADVSRKNSEQDTRLADHKEEIDLLRAQARQSEIELSKRASAIDFIQAEQAKRRPIVYKAPEVE